MGPGSIPGIPIRDWEILLLETGEVLPVIADDKAASQKSSFIYAHDIVLDALIVQAQ